MVAKTRSTLERYTVVAIAFHWVIAAMLILNLALGAWMRLFAEGFAKFQQYQLHKSIGVTVLLLSLGRLGWRLMRPLPPELPNLSRVERTAALATHWAFYGVMLVMPLTGWALVSTSSIDLPTRIFGLIPWPHLPLHALAAAPKAAWNGLAEKTHLVLAWGTLGLLGLHLGAVVKHHVQDGVPVLARMWPFGSTPPTSRMQRP